jgi:DNA-binding Xre family transcriptional regulator
MGSKTEHDDPIRGVIRVLLALRNEAQADLIAATGISKSTLIRRMDQGGWKLRELQAIAAHFDVDTSVLLSGPQELVRVPKGRRVLAAQQDYSRRRRASDRTTEVSKHSTCSASSDRLESLPVLAA